MVGIVEGGIYGAPYNRPFCPQGEACLLRTGGGIGLRLEWRFPSLVSTGIGLDYTFVDADGLHEVGTLATVRYTVRAAFLPTARYHPLLDAGLGLALFGDTFTIDTAGGALDLRGGVEIEVTPSMAVDLALGVRLLAVAPYTTDADGVRRGEPFGPSVMVGVHASLVLLPEPLRPRPPRHHPGGRDHD
jgi:hypothetical protein